MDPTTKFEFSVGADGEEESDLKKKRKGKKTIAKASNSNDVDVDVDDGRFGVADYGGQVAMRVQPNPKCRGCTHYDENLSTCEIGMVPAVCGDGSYPEIGYAPANPDRLAAKNWTARHKDAVASPAQAHGGTYEAGEVPYRVEVLGDSALALSERMTLVKSACATVRDMLGSGVDFQDPVVKAKVEELAGVEVRVPMLAPLHKSKLTVSEFAEAMGSTEDVVRHIARSLGSKSDFANFVKSKLPDIRMAHGLTEREVGDLFDAAMRTLKSLSSTEWLAWKGVNFQDNVEDEELARAIQQNGLLDRNAILHDGVAKAEHAETVPPLPAEPIQDPTNQPIAPAHSGGSMTNFVGGSLHLADSLSRRK